MPDDNFLQEHGQIISALIKDGRLTPDQVAYAARVRSKLERVRPLLDVVKELKYVSDDQIRESLRKHGVSMPIGSLLTELGLLGEADLQTAINMQKESSGQKLGEILIKNQFVDERLMVEVLSIQLGFPLLEPEFLDLDERLFADAPPKWCLRHKLIPIRREGEKVVVAFADPMDKDGIESAKQIFGNDILPAIALKKSIRTALDNALTGAKAKRALTVDEDSVVTIADGIILAAVENDASDIHIEPLKDRLRVRFRTDGVLGHHKDFSKEIIAPLTSRFKIMCGADIVEKRRHQGGRLFFDHGGHELDLRASFFVTVHGEKVVLRLLNRQTGLLPIEEIGMPPRTLSRFLDDALELPSGVVLITGPTGSGKTTTVYSCIKHISSPQTSIITAEEPVEYIIDGIAQCSINPKINLTFEETLRHIVRQDPDVIVIGEIRDRFSAEVAVQSALTGHKVLTTFHTEDSIGGLIRLLNMEIEAFLISSTVVSVVAQRLVRRVCDVCGEPYKPHARDLQRLGYTPGDMAGATFRKGRGCSNCRHSGYHGRVGVFELLVLDEEVRNAILERKTSHEIRMISIESTGLVTLLEDGIVKAAQGVTTLGEVVRTLPRLNPPRPLAELHRLQGL
ncbi:MAG: Flp pilus assembly complex ATPase component [Desulfobacterales bacterium]|nr:Flp pilus assembly complex ATPase component [Desulfobacterales bacterium]